MKKTLKNRSAFSLIELSIVLLIIGILIAGVTQSSRLINKSRINNARTLTQSAPVSSIANLALWIETTSEDSIVDSETEDSATVTNWYDINPQASLKASFTEGTNKPAYRSAAAQSINSLPVIVFDGSDDKMTAANFKNIVDQATVFLVVKTPATLATAAEAILGKTAAGGSSNIRVNIGVAAAGWQYCDNSGGTACYAATSTIAANTAYVVSMAYIAGTTTNGIRIFQNGTAAGPTSTSTASNAPDTTITASLLLGSDQLTSATFFNGSIGEVIVYDRLLKNEERQAVEDYLGKKWGIAISR